MRALAIVHQSLLNLTALDRMQQESVCSIHPQLMWLVRNYPHHPADPGWEVGVYCQCHRTFRNNRAQEGDLVADTINVKGEHRVRSAFYVKEKKECLIGDGLDLTFSEFYFVRAQPFVITSRFNRGDANSGKEVDAHLLLDALGDRSSYGLYSVGQKPESIPEDCWRTMSEAGGAARRSGTDHPCT